MAGNLTLALIKPHAVYERKVGRIIDRAEREGFSILLAKTVQFQSRGAEEFYSEHEGKEHFPKLVKTMSSGPIWALVLCKDNAVEEWRNLIGATHPSKAEEGTLRHEFGNHNNITNNAVHGSATDHDAKREINFFFARELKLVERINEISNQH